MYSGGESGHTVHTKPALFVSRITLYPVRSNRGTYVAAPTGGMERRGPYYNRLCRCVCVILYFYPATCGPKGHGSGGSCFYVYPTQILVNRPDRS